jgi:lysyl-tRNA synthetase class 2
MNSTTGLRFLRPSLHNDLSSARKAAYLRFFSTSRSLLGMGAAPRKPRNLNAIGQPIHAGIEFRGSIKGRIEELKAAKMLNWPRIKSDKDAMTIDAYLHKYVDLRPKESRDKEYVTVRGRLRAFRVAGKGLVFMDIAQDGKSVQIVCNRTKLELLGGMPKRRFEEFYHVIRRGDIICKTLCICSQLMLIVFSGLWKSIFHQRGRIINQCCGSSRDSFPVSRQFTKGAG